MKVQDAVKTLNGIDDVMQVLFSASEEEGTHIDYETVEKIRRLLLDYQADILCWGVHKY